MASITVHFDWLIQRATTEGCYAVGYYNCNSELIAWLGIVILIHYNTCYVINISYTTNKLKNKVVLN